MDAVAKTRFPWYVRLVVGSNPLFTLARTVVWAGLLIVLFKFVLLGVRVHGSSMEPTYHEGQIKFINRIAYLRHSPRRGDVVAFRLHSANAVVLKRIIALPGETLSIRSGGLIYINGKRLDEPYTKGATGFRAREYLLEPKQYWLIGDNRDISEQYFKYEYQILGKLIF